MALCFIPVSALKAQQDSLKPQTDAEKAVEKARHKAIYGNARKATIMSACLPGLGQAYNKKYWKVPIIYAALGGIVYWGIHTQKNYTLYANNLHAMYDNDPNTNNTTNYSADQLIILKNQYKKYRDYALMSGALVYLLNVVDANIDAHFKTFDVSNDLSLNVDPYSGIGYNNRLSAGVSLRLTFK